MSNSNLDKLNDLKNRADELGIDTTGVEGAINAQQSALEHFNSVQTPEQPAAAEEAPTGPDLKSLRELNNEHINHRLIREAQARQQDPPATTSPYHAKSKWDWHSGDTDSDDFTEGWDRIHLSRGMKDLALDNKDDDGNSQPLIELLGGAQRGDRGASWKWTDIGEREIAPILSAMHKFHLLQ